MCEAEEECMASNDFCAMPMTGAVGNMACAAAPSCSAEEEDMLERLMALDSGPVSKPVTKAPVVLPTFEQVITAQSSSGFWSKDKIMSLLEKFFDGGNAFDSAFMKSHPEIKDDLYATLIAIYILEQVFSMYSDEAELILRKAKNYLKNNGIKNPGNLIDELSLTIRA